MRNGLLAILLMIGLVWNAFAQVQPDEAKYELLRETINFLATDKAVSQDTNFRVSCQTLDYDCFKQQLSSKPIAGIERWYNSWRSMTVADEAGLVALRNQVFADIFERPGKGYRKQLNGYQGYLARIERLMDQPADEIPMEPITVDTLSGAILSPDDLYPPHSDSSLSGQNETPKKENTMIAYLAIAIAIVALVIAALPVFKRRERQLTDGFQELHERLNELAEQMKSLEAKTADGQINDAIVSLTDIMEAVEKRVVELENKSE